MKTISGIRHKGKSLITTRYSLNLILVQDPEDKGYTIFFKELPSIFSQGNNENEAILNLLRTIYTVLKESNKNFDELYENENKEE